MYPDPVEQATKLALFGMAGALANSMSPIHVSTRLYRH